MVEVTQAYIFISKNTQAIMMQIPFVKIDGAQMQELNRHLDQLAQMKVIVQGEQKLYFLFRDGRGAANMVWVQEGINGPLYLAEDNMSLADLLAFFHQALGPYNFTDIWAGQGPAPGPEVAECSFKLLRQRHHVLSLDVVV
jgi:hypothetical protein